MTTSTSAVFPALIETFGCFEPHAVVFDCDGVLLDTQALWDRTIAQFLEEHGVRIPPEQVASLVGGTVEHVVGKVANAVGKDPYVVGTELGRRYTQLMNGSIPVLPGAFELLAAIARKVPVAVASNTPRRYLVDNLRATGFLPLVDHVVGADDVREGKPAPDIYARACELLGVSPRDALAIEDSETGALSARAAGLRLVAAPIIPGQKPEADFTVAAIGEPALRMWAESWTPRRQRPSAHSEESASEAAPPLPSQPSSAFSTDSMTLMNGKFTGMHHDNPLGELRHFYPAGVVFDCDGLILDTESVWEEVQQDIIARHNATLTPAQEVALMGTTLEQAVEVLAEVTGEEYEDLLARTRAEFTEAISGELRFMPGAKEFVELVASKVPIAVASNSWHSALEDKLTRCGLIHLCENLQSSDTVANGKPAPDMYAKAVRDMGLEPSECLAFEDSPLGGRAAKSAGLVLVGVPSTRTPLESADVSVASLEDPALIAWVQSWPQRT